MSNGGFRRGLLVGTDLKGYGTADDRRQDDWQHLLLRCLDRAGAAAGLNRQSWATQAKGDEEFAVVPASESEPAVVDRFVRHLCTELHWVNRERVPTAWLRLRMAIHHGVLVDGANGWPGQDPVMMSRLLNSEVLHRALAADAGHYMAVMLSDQVYRSVVLAGQTSMLPAQFRSVEVREKGFRGTGWIWVPNADVHAIDLREDQGEAPDRSDPVLHQHTTTTGGSTSVQAGGDVVMGADRAARHVYQAKVINQVHGGDFSQATFGLRYSTGDDRD